MVSGLGAAFGGVEVATHRMIGEEIELLLPCVCPDPTIIFGILAASFLSPATLASLI
jgi:hypothetical protein